MDLRTNTSEFNGQAVPIPIQIFLWQQTRYETAQNYLN